MRIASLTSLIVDRTHPGGPTASIDPQAQTARVPGAGHAVARDRAAAFNALALAFPGRQPERSSAA